MLLRPFLYNPTACASYLFGCGTHAKLAVVDPHAELVDDYLATAAALGAPIVAVFETHVQADHVSGLPEIVERRARPPTCQQAPRSTSRTLSLATATSSSWETPSCMRSRPRVTHRHTTRTWLPIAAAAARALAGVQR